MPAETSTAKAKAAAIASSRPIKKRRASDEPDKGDPANSKAAGAAKKLRKGDGAGVAAGRDQPPSKKRRASDGDGDPGPAAAAPKKKLLKGDGSAAVATPDAQRVKVEVAPPPGFLAFTWGVKQDAVDSVVAWLFFRHGPGQEQQQKHKGSGGGGGAPRLEYFSLDLVPAAPGRASVQPRLCSVAKPWSEANSGARLDNFLALRLSRELHAALSKAAGAASPGDLAARLVERVLRADPGASCVVCGAGFGAGVKLWRPTPCSAACKRRMAAEVPLGVRLSPLLVDHLVLDFLLCCLNSRFHPSVRAKLPARPADKPEFPRLGSWAEMFEALKSFPAIDGASTLETILGNNSSREQRKEILCWLSTEFQGCLVSASRLATVGHVRPGATRTKPIHQFVFLNSTLDRQKAFEKKRNKGIAVFHATPAYNILPLVQDGLQDLRGRRGIFFGGSFATSSYGYQKGVFFEPWPNSVFKAYRSPEMVFGAEYRGPWPSAPTVGDPRSWFEEEFQESHTFDQSDIMLRYVFLTSARDHVYPTHAQYEHGDFLPGSDTRKTMEETFERIKRGEVAKVRGAAQIHAKALK